MRQTAVALLCLFALLVIVASAGCSGSMNTPPAPQTSPAAALVDLKTKDAETLDATGKIDSANKANPEPARATISAQTARLFDLVRLQPWTKTEAVILAITAERDAALTDAAKLRTELDKADLKTTRTIRLGLASTGALLAVLTVGAGLMVAKTGAVFFGLGRDIVIGLGLLSALSFFSSIAYAWAARHQGLFVGVGAVIALAGAVLFYANLRNEKLNTSA